MHKAETVMTSRKRFGPERPCQNFLCPIIATRVCGKIRVVAVRDGAVQETDVLACVLYMDDVGPAGSMAEVIRCRNRAGSNMPY